MKDLTSILEEAEELNTFFNRSDDQGIIRLGQERMILFHINAMAAFRAELIENLGVQRARGIITRMGYTAGVKDADLARKIRPDASDEEAYSIGPYLHQFESGVKVTEVKLEMNIAKGQFYGEFNWENSYESSISLDNFGISQEPVCWFQIGYASGYSSAFMGEFIVYREDQCSGMGHKHCRIIGKPFQDWGQDNAHASFFKPEHFADQIVALQTQVDKLRMNVEPEYELDQIIGKSSNFQKVQTMLNKVMDKEVTVLLNGETGTGKDLFANKIHYVSPRGKGPFVALNCAAIPEELIESELFGVEKGAFTGCHKSRAGKFERAHGGTLFLDEINQLSPSAQSKLLRAIQNQEIERVGDTTSRKVDVRIIAATNTSLENCVKSGAFRKDLFFRLNVYPVDIPPLRERKDDIELLARHFIKKVEVKYNKSISGIDKNALIALENYSWPGNIRELENVIERGVLLAENNAEIQLRDLSFSSIDENDSELQIQIDRELDTNDTGQIDELINSLLLNDHSGFTGFEQLEKMVLLNAVKLNDGNLSAAARKLGITRPQLAYRMKKLEIS